MRAWYGQQVSAADCYVLYPSLASLWAFAPGKVLYDLVWLVFGGVGVTYFAWRDPFVEAIEYHDQVMWVPGTEPPGP